VVEDLASLSSSSSQVLAYSAKLNNHYRWEAPAACSVEAAAFLEDNNNSSSHLPA